MLGEVERVSQSQMKGALEMQKPPSSCCNKLLSVLRRGGGRNKSSKENVRAAAPPLGWGLLRLKMDGFLIPSRPKMEFLWPPTEPPRPPLPPFELRMVAFELVVDCWGFGVVNCSCSRSEVW